MTTDEKITRWSAKYMNGTNILDRGSEYVLKNGLNGYYGTNGGKVSLPKVVGSNQSTNGDNQMVTAVVSLKTSLLCKIPL